jgi:hypothetical protein
MQWTRPDSSLFFFKLSGWIWYPLLIFGIQIKLSYEQSYVSYSFVMKCSIVSLQKEKKCLIIEDENGPCNNFVHLVNAWEWEPINKSNGRFLNVWLCLQQHGRRLLFFVW